MSRTELPRFELYGGGSQIRRSSTSVRSNIVEGYDRRKHKQYFIRFLCYADASRDETTDHVEALFETGSLNNSNLFEDLCAKTKALSKMIKSFLSSVERHHMPARRMWRW